MGWVRAAARAYRIGVGRSAPGGIFKEGDAGGQKGGEADESLLAWGASRLSLRGLAALRGVDTDEGIWVGRT